MADLRLLNVTQDVGESDESLRERASKLIGVDPAELRGFRIAQRSVDARRRPPRFVCHVDLIVDDDTQTPAMTRLRKKNRLREAPEQGSLTLAGVPDSIRGTHAVVVGSGPAGLFAALSLGRNGVKVTLIDRGARLEERGPRLVRFHRTRIPDPETNLLFGEGGAGTYSDGKLYTRVDHPLEIPILDELVACGAPADILYDSRSHIGTDRLHRLLPLLRAKLEDAGVEFFWNTRLDGVVMDGDRIRAVATSQGEIGCDWLVLALGHSARDTWARLHGQGLPMQAKPFQFGLRVEHPQELITRARYGESAIAQSLGPASYSLVARARHGVDACHSFCMCPGGTIVASVNEPGRLCTNGMSNSRHSSPYANSGLVVTFNPNDYGKFGLGPLAGVAFQRHYEETFFRAGGGDYTVPAQRVSDFLAGRESAGEIRTSSVLGTKPARLDELLPGRARAAIARGIEAWESRIPGFAGDAGVLVGVESRSSGPVRMPRDDETRRAEGFSNVFPIGEGAGYAGGIMSAALDGARSAHALLETGI
ncbi:MAG: NAD(P)/FAD-dependent oxidoreductase [Planctomycetota bacterium]|jgi:uncharacterized FAD-dependent dehydrogenase